jgi:hypothetical protein
VTRGREGGPPAISRQAAYEVNRFFALTGVGRPGRSRTGLTTSRRIVFRRFCSLAKASRNEVAGWNEQRRSTQDSLDVALREELAFLRKLKEHALGGLARLPKRSGASSSLLKPASETNPLGSNEGSRSRG